MSIIEFLNRMLEKVAQFFKLPKKYPEQFYFNSQPFLNSPKSC